MRQLLVILLLFLAIGLGLSSWSVDRWRKPYVKADTTVVIAPGSRTEAILDQLAEAHVLPAPWKVAVPFLLGGKRSLKAGEYEFSKGMTPAQVIGRIRYGKVVVHAVTVPEGFTVAQVRARLNADPLLTGEVPPVIQEGSLFPDTWRYEWGESRATLIARMQARMEKELAAAWAGRDPALPLTTPQEALILASIVEDETAIAAERALVASVYLNRLQIPMRLQSDPTVAYGIAPDGMKRQLTTRDLARDTPYNTYTRDGLPPGPICNPGLASLQAVMHPLDTEFLYFVATGTDGGHRFSESMREHETNVRAYRKVKREAVRAKP